MLCLHSTSFYSKNQLAKEGTDNVAQVVISALALILAKSLKADRSLCPVRALHYFLYRTLDLTLCLLQKKGSDKDISPATIS